MKIRYVLLAMLIAAGAYIMCTCFKTTPQTEPQTPVVEMVAQPNAPEAMPETDMENLSPEDAEKDQ